MKSNPCVRPLLRCNDPIFSLLALRLFTQGEEICPGGSGADKGMDENFNFADKKVT